MKAKADGLPAEARDPLLEKLQETINGLIFTKRRLPLVANTARELDELVAAMQRRSPAGTEVHVRNDAVLQLIRDAFDMLVIDLASLREGFTNNGCLNELARQPERIKLCSPDEFARKTATAITVAEDGTESVDVMESIGNQLVADGVNAAIRSLFGNEFPVTPAAVEALITRFRKDTEDIHRDRNHVRAHRYEYRPGDPSKHFQPLSALPEHIAVFDKYVGDLYLVLTRNSYHLELPFWASHSGTATDLADLIVHGSIDSATLAYGMPRRTEDNPVPWYYWHRKQFFEAPGTPDSEGGE